MTSMEQMKQKAKAVWSDFALMENFTGMAAPRLVKFADINAIESLYKGMENPNPSFFN